MHVIDAAVIYAELERAGAATQADLARRYHKSPGYVSVLCRLGHAIRAIPPHERSVLRTPRVTFKAAQVVVSRSRDPLAIVAALQLVARSARGDARPRTRRTEGGTAVWRTPVAVPPDLDRLDPLPALPGVVAARTADLTFRWDEGAARQDPSAVYDAFEAFVRAAMADVIERLRRAAGSNAGVLGASAPDASLVGGGQNDASAGLATDHPDSALPPNPSPGLDRPAFAVFDLSLRHLDARVDATLRAHRERMTAFLADRENPRATSAPRNPQPPDAPITNAQERGADRAAPERETSAPATGDQRGRGGSFLPVAVTDEEIADDLA